MSFLAGTDAAESSSFWCFRTFPYVELEHTDTVISIVNAGIAPAGVTAQLVGLDGIIIGTLSITVPASGCRKARMSELFRDVSPNNSSAGKKFDGDLRLSADMAHQRVGTYRYTVSAKPAPGSIATIGPLECHHPALCYRKWKLLRICSQSGEPGACRQRLRAESF